MSSIVVSGDTSGAITVAAPTTAGTSTLTLPSGASGTIAAQGVSTNIVSGTAVASTSGTSIDFTGIPSWVRRITVMFNGVSNVAGNSFMVQLGDAGGIENTGYSGSTINMSSGGTGATAISDSFLIRNAAGASTTLQGQMTICAMGSNVWNCQAVFGNNNIATITGGSKTLSDTLTQVRITNAASDTFDAGSINILYE
jgi:hypothetical protein